MFSQTLKEFFQSKTNWAGMTMIVHGGFELFMAYHAKLPMPATAITEIMTGIGLVAVKDAIAKK